MWSFVQNKKQKIWIWLAFERQTGKAVFGIQLPVALFNSHLRLIDHLIKAHNLVRECVYVWDDDQPYPSGHGRLIPIRLPFDPAIAQDNSVLTIYEALSKDLPVERGIDTLNPSDVLLLIMETFQRRGEPYRSDWSFH